MSRPPRMARSPPASPRRLTQAHQKATGSAACSACESVLVNRSSINWGGSTVRQSKDSASFWPSARGKVLPAGRLRSAAALVVDGVADSGTDLAVRPPVPTRTLFGVALVSGSLLMTELSLTRIFSVTMYYHFAFMAISIALFGLSASGVYVFLMRDRRAEWPTERLLALHSLAYAALTAVALAVLVKLRVGLTYTPSN